MAKSRVLIVEDDHALREALVTTLELAGLTVFEAGNGEEALAKLLAQPVDLVVSDVNMPGMNGHELLQQVQRRFPGTPMMLITAYGQISHAVSAMQAGAVDYLVKPFEPQVLIDGVMKVVGGALDVHADDAPIAEDPGSQRIFQLARKVAQCDSTVMISGESGTGKEVLARFIHQHSTRAKGPFVAINCAAIPENMLEAMLFGHEKGAFTGAHAASPGKFEQANGGTLLLDEVSEMDMGLQAKLLRVLQEREVERVGGRKPVALDVRVIATTNRDLRHHVEAGKFREDLYYRLSVFPMHWQPLRERMKDLLPLAEYLLHKHARKMKAGNVSLSADARKALLAHQWPGNVRELDNALQRALVLHHGQMIGPEDLCLEPPRMASTRHPVTTGMAIPAMVPQDHAMTAGASMPETAFSEDSYRSPDTDASKPDGAAGSLGDDLRQREFVIIIETLRKAHGRRKQAAETLGISPRTLRYKLAQMRDCGIDVDEEMAVA